MSCAVEKQKGQLNMATMQLNLNKKQKLKVREKTVSLLKTDY